MQDLIVKTFLDLVRIDSPSGFENEVREYLIGRLLTLGIRSDIDKEGNLFAGVSGIGQPLILCAHLDTVEPGRGIKPIVSKGIIKSDGTTILGADNKVSVAGILTALGLTQASNRRALEIIFSVREETDGGINKFDFTRLKSKFGLVADSSFPVGGVVLSSPWIQELKFRIMGRAAHAGVPEKGINALSIAAGAYSKLTWGRLDNKTTSNIGLVNGGLATNTVPDDIFLEGEVRSFSKESLNKYLSQICWVFESETKAHKGTLEVFSEPYCSGYVHRKEDNHIKMIAHAVEKTGLKVRYQKTFGGSDANTFNARGIRVVNIGDGTKNSHTVNESVSVESLVDLTKVITNYITN